MGRRQQFQGRAWVRWILGGLVAWALSGCVSATVNQHVVYQELCAKRFLELVRSGETSRAEEQEYIQANERAWHFLREAMGIKSLAEKTKEAFDGKENDGHKNAVDGRKTR